MSDVVKLPKKKKSEIDDWIAVDNSPVEVFKEQFFQRVYDQIMISEIHGMEEDIPRDVMDHAFVAILIQILVYMSSSRDVVDPERLKRLLKVEIGEWFGTAKK